MSSLRWKLAGDRFKNCKDCRIEQKPTYRNVVFCEACNAHYAAEHAAHASLEPTENNIREIVNGRVELFDCKRIYEHFYELWMHEMPYGTAKARDGDPHEWIFDHLCYEYSHLIEQEEVVG